MREVRILRMCEGEFFEDNIWISEREKINRTVKLAKNCYSLGNTTLVNPTGLDGRDMLN
jgi:preprotein translocase subunit SecA